MKLIFLLIFIIFAFVDCKRNITEQVTFPISTEFNNPINLDTKNARVEIIPKMSQSGNVFGGYKKKIKYLNKWYISADDMYEYYETSKRLVKVATNVIISLDDNNSIEIYAFNLSASYLKNNYSTIYGSDNILNVFNSLPNSTDWAFLNNVYYLKKYYELSIPTNYISNMVYKLGKTSFFLENTTENINQYRLCVSYVEPNNNVKDFYFLQVLNPIFTTLYWMGGSDFLFNIEDKIIRLVDYSKTDLTFDYPYILNTKKDERDIWYERGLLGGYTNYYESFSKIDCYYNAVINDAWCQIYEFYINNIIYFMPDKAISHYSIDIRY